MANRSHGKIRKLPPIIKKAVEAQLIAGRTYEEIAEYLNGMGHKVSVASVCRFGKPFVEMFESVRMAKEAAQYLAEDNADRPSTELHEANNTIASQMIMKLLVDENITADEKLKAVNSLTSLQRAQAQNERVKILSREKAGAIKSAMKMLRERIVAEIQKYPDLTAQIIELVDEVEKEVQST